MGCCCSCFVRSREVPPCEAAVTQEHRVDATPRVINSAANAAAGPDQLAVRQPSSFPPVETTNHRSRSSRRRSQASHLPLNEHYNQPVRLHAWRSKHRIWTRAQLSQERKEFFETRVTGRSEVWAALSAATSLLQEGDLTTAQSILDAAGVTVPTGNLSEGCYDQNGVLYRLPHCIVSDPENVVDDSAGEQGDGVTDLDGDAISDRKLAMSEESEDELIPEDLERRREEKGKMSERDLIKVKARLSDRGGPDIPISIGKLQSVGLLANKVQTEAGISGKQRVRIAYLGRILKEDEPLLEQGWKAGHIVNALVVAMPSSS
ncbi:hypothetical protein V8E54_014187 [Elaphomyces granulatus]